MSETFDHLYTLALDLRRSSSSDADELWECVDPTLWKTNRNPWVILQTLSEKRRKELEEDKDFLLLLRRHVERKQQALKASQWYQGKNLQVAYFSMEFGLSEALPIYSGGLGLLAGDHLKACSDLGVPLVGVGLLYQQGYFRQEIAADGKQIALYPYNEPSQLPIQQLPLRLTLEFPGRDVYVRVFQAQVGNIPLYLLDTNDMLNTPLDRAITGELYGGGPQTRLKQEVVLGIGGVRLLEALGIDANVYHLNEGHAAFAILERTRMLQKGRSFKEAFAMAKKGTLFTTHTPVEAGFDRFPIELIRKGFAGYAQALGIPLEDLLSLGQLNKEDPFNMAYLAVRGSAYVNGVSKLHGEVSQKLFAPLKATVGYVTNGVHIPSWESPEADKLWCHCSGEHRWYGTLETLEKEIQAISDTELWSFRNKSRQKLLQYTRERVHTQLNSSGAGEKVLKVLENFLDPEVLTVGFSRRFATYKRVDLLLHDPKRLTELLKTKKMQLIIAGKAHPQDEIGKHLIEKWVTFTSHPEVRPFAVFLSDYDILLAERLVQGMDLWINTPHRPWEASGTSGMKLCVNGGLNLSVLDGWWAEAYQKEVGWALEGEDDEKDANTLYDLLETEVIPLFYARDPKGIPSGWLKKVKESMARLTPQYSTNRMVREYVEKYYEVIAHG
ncbi:MAG: alpha-glucan family phosphorylase [Chlamydiia bacterium]|nr:alpha-glucan family phosphorylase [Chlamydiia bacterium]